MNIYSQYLFKFYQVIYIFSISLSFLSHLLFFPCAFLSPVLTFSIFLLYTNIYLLYDYIFCLFLSLDNSFFSLSFPFLTPFAFFLPFCQSFFLPFIQFHLLNSIQFCAPLQAACDFPRFIPLSTHVLNYPRWRELCN